jgi:hypothetical protein
VRVALFHRRENSGYVGHQRVASFNKWCADSRKNGRSATAKYNTALQRVPPIRNDQIRGDLTLAGLSGEVVVDYVPLLEKALGPDRLWIAANCHACHFSQASNRRSA